jgi:hypothetical protein
MVSTQVVREQHMKSCFELLTSQLDVNCNVNNGTSRYRVLPYLYSPTLTLWFSISYL